jgi:sugar phosphate isomerase/epimerase
MVKPIGVQLYTVREALGADLDGTLARLAGMGLRFVETAGTANLDPAQFRRRLDGAGLSVMAAHVGLPDAAGVEQTAATLRALGATWMFVSSNREQWATLDGVKAQAAAFERAAQLMAPHGLRVGLHNHWWEFGVLGSRLAIEHFLELAPEVQLELDVYWAANFGRVDVPGFARTYAGRIVMLHLKDGPLVEGQPHTALGAGRMDIPACVAAADPRVLNGLIIELDECATDMVQAVRQSVKYLAGAGLGAV